MVIGRRGRGLNSTFTVRRISYGEGVERVFPVHSPRVDKVEVERKGAVRRAKLTGLRRNDAMAMGNSGNREFLPTLEKLRDDEDSIVAGSAAWALEKLARS